MSPNFHGVEKPSLSSEMALVQRLRTAQNVKLIIDGFAFSVRANALAKAVEVDGAGPVSPNTFRLSGNVWVVEFDGKTGHWQDTPRMRYLHALLKEQGRMIRCTHILSTARGEVSHALRDEQIKELLDQGILTVTSELSTAVLPTEARRRLLAVIEDLEGEVEALRLNGEAEPAMEKEEQVASIKAELRRHQYNGHNVNFANRATRDRNAVGNGIRRLIQAIRPLNLSLSNHLTNSIKLGYTCSYQPERPISWLL